MTREVDLVSYLPPFMMEFKEIRAALEAENPEFALVWKAADQILQNAFIETADESGIAQFENSLKILPSTEDTLESRRARVQSRWFSTIPYSLKAFVAQLAALCGDSDFTVTKEYQNYKVEILTNLELFGQTEELEKIFHSILPCNMTVEAANKIQCTAAGDALAAGGVCTVEEISVSSETERKE